MKLFNFKRTFSRSKALKLPVKPCNHQNNATAKACDCKNLTIVSQNTFYHQKPLTSWNRYFHAELTFLKKPLLRLSLFLAAVKATLVLATFIESKSMWFTHWLLRRHTIIIIIIRRWHYCLYYPNNEREMSPSLP